MPLPPRLTHTGVLERSGVAVRIPYTPATVLRRMCLQESLTHVQGNTQGTLMVGLLVVGMQSETAPMSVNGRTETHRKFVLMESYAVVNMSIFTTVH